MRLRKLAALAMTAVLSFTVLAGCGSDDKNEIKTDGKKAASISEAFEKAAAMEKYTFSGSYTVTVSGDDVDYIDEEIKSAIGGGNGITLAGTWEGKADTKNNAVDVSMGVSLGGKSAVKLLDYVLVDGDAYIGLGTMADGIDNLLSQVSDILEEGSIREIMDEKLPDGNYLKVSKENLKEIMDIFEEAFDDMLQQSGMPITSGSYEDIMSELMNSDEYKELQENIKYFAELLVKGMKSSDSCFTNDGDTYRMTINKNNINDVLSGVLNEVEKNSDDIAKKINSMAGDDVVSSEQLKQMASLFSVYDIASLMDEYDFSLSLSASYVDDTFKAGIAFAFSDSSNTMAVSFENTAKKDDSLKISAPSDVISDEDAKPIIDEFMKGFREGVNGSLGDLSFDDFDNSWDNDWNDDDWDYNSWDDDDGDDNNGNANNSLNNNFNHDDSHHDDTHHDDSHHNYLNQNDDSKEENSTISSNSSNKMYGSIKEYVESDEFQKQVETQMKLYEGMGMDMTITAEGNKLVYTYKYTDEKLIDDDYTLEDAREYFDSAINEQKSTFTSICKQLPIYIDVENPVVALRYYDLDNTLIWEKEFTAED